MEELELLRKKLDLIQKDKISQKLTERNCIEILLKMIELKMIDIIFSLDGKEYITPKQLEYEIQDEILRSGGRVVVNDLQSLLNIDSSHIKVAIESILKEDQSIRMYQGELLTNYYLDSCFQEIKEQLLEVGKLNLNDLSNRFQLSNEQLLQLVQSKIKNNDSQPQQQQDQDGSDTSSIIFDSQSNTIYTKQHINRHLHKVIGLFSSITQPCIISQLIRQSKQLQQYQLNEKLVLQQLQQLIESKRIQGQIQGKGSNAEYIPNVYSIHRSKWIESFYNQNQFITFDSLLKLQINDPQSYLKTNFKNGLSLSTTFINISLIDKIDDMIAESIKNASWFEISQLVPSPLTSKDIQLLISNCPTMKINQDNNFQENAIVLGDYYIISKSFIDRCFTLLKNTIQERIEQNKLFKDVDQKDQQTVTLSSTSSKQQNKISTSKSKGSRGKQEPPPEFKSNNDDSDHSDEDNSDNDKKKINKENEEYEIIGSSNNNNKKQNQKNKQQQQQQQQQQKQQSNKKIDYLNEIIQLLKKWYGNSMDDELLELLTQYLRPLVNKTWESLEKEAQDKIENESMKERKQQHKQLLNQFNQLHLNFLLFKKGLDSFISEQPEIKKETIIQLEKHLLKTICTNITNLLIEFNANYHMLESHSLDTPAQRSSLLLQLPSQLSKSLEKLIQSLNKSSTLDFIDSLEKASAQSQIKLKQLDKKIEKQFLLDHKNELNEQLFNENENDIYNQFQIIVNLLYIKFKNQYVFAPPRSIGSLIQSITNDESLSDQDQVKNNLNSLYQSIIKSFKPNDNINEKEELNQNIINLINYFKDYLNNNL